MSTFDKFIEITDLERTTNIYSGLPMYKYEGQNVFPLEVSNEDIDRIRSHVSKYPMDSIDVDISTDEDPVKYWGGQTVYVISYDRKSRLDTVFIVRDIDLEYDDEYYDLESFVVTIVPLRRKN